MSVAPTSPEPRPLSAAPTSAPALQAPWQLTAWLEELCLRNRKAIVIGVVLFYLLSFNGLWRFSPDSALYLSIGRSLARGEGYTYQGMTQHLASPGLPYLIAAAMRLSPKNAVAIVDSAMLLMGLTSIYLAWHLFRRLTRPGAAIAASVLLAANFNLYQRCFDILPDIPFFMGSVMILLGCVMSRIIPVPLLDELSLHTSRIGRWIGVTILLVGLAICTLFGPIFFALAACVATIGVISAIFQRRWRSGLMLTSLIGAIGGIYLLATLSEPYGVAQVTQLLLQCAPVSPYMIPLLPVLALAWWELAARVNARLGKQIGNIVAITMFAVLIPGAIRCASDVWHDQYRLPFADHYYAGQWAAVVEAGKLIRASTPPDAVVVAPEGTDRVLTFLADRWVIPADQPASDRMRGHPVYALVQSQTRPKDIDLGESIGQTDFKSPTGETYLLKKAKWK